MWVPNPGTKSGMKESIFFFSVQISIGGFFFFSAFLRVIRIETGKTKARKLFRLGVGCAAAVARLPVALDR